MDGIEPGTIMLETFSSISAIAPKQLQVDRYLPITPLRTLISKDRKNYAKLLSHDKLNTLCQKIERQTAHAIIKQIKPEIETMIDFASKFTDSKFPEVRKEAQQRVNTLLEAESRSPETTSKEKQNHTPGRNRIYGRTTSCLHRSYQHREIRATGRTIGNRSVDLISFYLFFSHEITAPLNPLRQN